MCEKNKRTRSKFFTIKYSFLQFYIYFNWILLARLIGLAFANLTDLLTARNLRTNVCKVFSESDIFRGDWLRLDFTVVLPESGMSSEWRKYP